MYRQTGLFTDADRFLNTGDKLGPFAANMTYVNAMVPRDDPGDFNQFFGVGQRSGNVDQSGGHSEHAVQHRFVSQGSHLFQLCHRWLSCALTHDLAAKASLGQQVSDMRPGTVLVDCVQILSGIHRSHPAVSCDNGRTSLQQIVDVRPSIAFEDGVVAVVVQINETW